MPIFEFECLQCGLQFEKLMRRAGAISDVACPVCESRNVEEKLSTFASLSGGSTSGSPGGCAPSGGG